jgi:ribosomal protein RSM22 (predicted rRNA methylase)
MQLPEELQLAIDRIVEKAPPTALKKAREALSFDYRHGRGSIFEDEEKRLAYIGARMPATFGAVFKALEKLKELYSFPESIRLLDLGAGPGTASWAAASLFNLDKITLIEKSHDAIALGKALAKESALGNAEWLCGSLSDIKVFPEADLAVLSYAAGELGNPEELIERLYNSPVGCILVVEPGTPQGFHLIRKIRQQMIDLGANLIAPCPHQFACPIQGSDWCHFSARVERTRLHRQLKEGTLGHEDEKFSYVAAATKPGLKITGRIVRHLQKHSGHTRMTLCTNEGKLEEKTVTRSQKGLYRQARDAEWGDIWNE